MYNDIQTSAIMSAGMKALRDSLDALEVEIFITTICNKDFDYTKWRENLWENLTPRELIENAAAGYSAPKGVQVV